MSSGTVTPYDRRTVRQDDHVHLVYAIATVRAAEAARYLSITVGAGDTRRPRLAPRPVRTLLPSPVPTHRGGRTRTIIGGTFARIARVYRSIAPSNDPLGINARIELARSQPFDRRPQRWLSNIPQCRSGNNLAS